MDYEKKYKEALEIARKINSRERVNASSGWTGLEVVFPELRESEDERIRKALVWHLKADADFVSNGVTKAECMSYLERQKEQKPAEWEDYKVNIPYCSSEPEWSEEDERILKGIIGKIDHDQTYGVSKAEMLSFLKSLRPVSKESLQPHWKPSEEQISSLKQARDYYMSGGIKYVGRHLSEIAEQLEKLM